MYVILVHKWLFIGCYVDINLVSHENTQPNFYLKCCSLIREIYFPYPHCPCIGILKFTCTLFIFVILSLHHWCLLSIEFSLSPATIFKKKNIYTLAFRNLLIGIESMIFTLRFNKDGNSVGKENCYSTVSKRLVVWRGSWRRRHGGATFKKKQQLKLLGDAISG